MKCEIIRGMLQAAVRALTRPLLRDPVNGASVPLLCLLKIDAESRRIK